MSTLRYGNHWRMTPMPTPQRPAVGSRQIAVDKPFVPSQGRDPHDFVTMDLPLDATTYDDEVQVQYVPHLLAAKAALAEGREDVCTLLLMQWAGMPVDSTTPEPL